jgi:AraC family transcriptional regulator
LSPLITQLVGKIDRVLYTQGQVNEPGDILIGRLAEEAGMSRFKLLRRFKQETGLGLQGFISNIKLDAAAAYVRLTNQPLLDIAINMGYNGQQSFTRAFTRRWGISPLRMRGSAKAAYAGFFAAEADSAIPQRIEHLRARRTLWFKRYTGPYTQVLQHWDDFRAELARLGLGGAAARHYGVIYDDPDITAPELIRYGCGIEAPAGAAEPPEGWLAFAIEPSRFVVFAIHCTYQEGMVRLRPRVLSWFGASREAFGTAGVFEIYDEPPVGEARSRSMELHISLAN